MKFLVIFAIFLLSSNLWGCQPRISRTQEDTKAVQEFDVDKQKTGQVAETKVATPVSAQINVANEIRVQLSTKNGKYYVVAEGGGGAGLNVNRHNPQNWETFTLIDQNGGELVSGDRVQLRAWNGKHYVVAEGGGGGGLNANRTDPKEWETFTLIQNNRQTLVSGDLVQLRASNGRHYVVAEGGGGAGLNANRTDPKEWETFKLIILQ